MRLKSRRIDGDLTSGHSTTRASSNSLLAKSLSLFAAKNFLQPSLIGSLKRQLWGVFCFLGCAQPSMAQGGGGHQ
jgi:hypothetical protein